MLLVYTAAPTAVAKYRCVSFLLGRLNIGPAVARSANMETGLPCVPKLTRVDDWSRVA